MEWALIVQLFACNPNYGGDAGIIPGNCFYSSVPMPSVEICWQVRNYVNDKMNNANYARCEARLVDK
jgi:hypothetical protein